MFLLKPFKIRPLSRYEIGPSLLSRKKIKKRICKEDLWRSPKKGLVSNCKTLAIARVKKHPFFWKCLMPKTPQKHQKINDLSFYNKSAHFLKNCTLSQKLWSSFSRHLNNVIEFLFSFKSALTRTLGNSNFEELHVKFPKKRYFLRTRKNFTSRKLPRFQQSYLMALFAIFESTLTAHNYRVGNFTLVNYFVIWVFWKFPKNHKKCLMSLTKKIWSFLIGGWTCNPLDHSDCPQLQVRNFKFEKKAF